ncbi:TPA: hypothetical protein ACKRDV_003155 [Proteus mirabilis]|uniref:hypothetical protein n=1 Tax=Proteus mirabilis TaxID=584 RepID=UPI0009D3770A|nr:hypothetical protein [Proteus mirabilis]MBG2992589.1 hypothetical protein [Proteus mirabilis]MBS3857104.1 hypothetical protein [Proteus mirabilis]OOQ55794.1 hypothetical protein A0O00_15000 [Proteus mirabilis]HDT2999091.1 hypothetical protein [Proteus mirabilis]HEI8297206.1 hypothetical protein [Proteus mirabilis]
MDIDIVQNGIHLSEKILKAFPTRALTLSPLKGDGGLFRTLFLVIAMLGMTVFSAYQIPNIIYDYQISKNPVFIDADVDGSCRSKLFVLTNCSVDLRYEGNEVSRNFTFLDFGNKDILVEPVADENDLTKMTVDVAIDNIWLRLISAFVFTALFAFCVIFFIYRQMISNKVKKALLSVGTKPLKLTAIPAKVVVSNKQFIATYKTNVAGKETSITYSGNKKTPPITLEMEGKTYVLAVYEPQQNIPYVLDVPLARIQATEEEKQRFHEALIEEGIL